MGDQLIKFPLKQLMAEYAVAICVEIFACSGECVCTLYYHEYDKPSPDFSEALNIQCRHKNEDRQSQNSFTELISPHHRNSQNSVQQALELMHLRQVRLKSITPDIAAKIMRP